MVLLVALALLPALARAESPTVSFSDTVPTDGEFFWLPFDVPSGTVEIEVRHASLSEQDKNILDWGVRDEQGRFRGWGGGNSEPAIVGVDRASRSYLTGPINPGTWKVLVGKAKIVDTAGRYQVDVFLRTSPTLAAQPERRPYADVAPLKAEARWYAGDLHVHSVQSGDAHATIDEIAVLAQSRGLQWVELSDHNTTAQLDYIGGYQDKYPNLLIMPGVEFTTYHGHANGIGATSFVDHTIGFNGVTIENVADSFLAQGAVFSPNHPLLDLPGLCIGCAWSYNLPPTTTHSFEIATGGWNKAGQIFGPSVIAAWDALLDTGAHIAPVGGSDDHTAGENEGQLGSPIGDPTTLVHAANLSTPAILQAIRDGHTVVKLQGPGDPMATITTDDGHIIGDTVHSPTSLHVTVTGGQGKQLRFVKNGNPMEPTPITGDPFALNQAVGAPDTGADRWRVEVMETDMLNGLHPITVTSHVWIAPALPKKKTGCAATGGEVASFAALVAMLFRRRQKAARLATGRCESEG